MGRRYRGVTEFTCDACGATGRSDDPTPQFDGAVLRVHDAPKVATFGGYRYLQQPADVELCVKCHTAVLETLQAAGIPIRPGQEG